MVAKEVEVWVAVVKAVAARVEARAEATRVEDRAAAQVALEVTVVQMVSRQAPVAPLSAATHEAHGLLQATLQGVGREN